MAHELRPDYEERKRPGVEREYRTSQGEIVVYWEPKICNHTGNCFRGLPEVFQPQNRPWVLVDATTVDKIAEVVMTSPTGALHFERFDGGPQEPEETTIDARPNGPLHIRGRLQIVGPGSRFGKIPVSRFADVVLLRTSRFVMGLNVELDFAQQIHSQHPPHSITSPEEPCYDID